MLLNVIDIIFRYGLSHNQFWLSHNITLSVMSFPCITEMKGKWILWIGYGKILELRIKNKDTGITAFAALLEIRT